MIRLMGTVASRLKKTIFDKKNKENWYEVYLTCFILLSTLEKVYELQLFYSDINVDMGGNTPANVNYTSRTMMEKWKYSAENLIYHYRCILRGMDPFSLSWEAWGSVEDVAKANLDTPAILYMQKMSDLLKDRHDFMARARQQVGKPFSWLCELFLPDEAGDSTPN
ncbi:hypothetical protein QQS21_010660 [Conoideocrella luteorostrata]|uniref:Uncharacterized protein n=1 Tax=Conoideocrella luteorostrata TaxID=1105319 RepID=A0AAJ0CER7_9HYPO|nr:hypothetical protein QQS21_010660 [Conoideocrella luteorostrata]